MSIIHHPDDATLMGFAAGTLSEPFGIIVSAHLDLCAQCRQASRTLDGIGAAAMQKSAPSDLVEGALGRLMARLDEPAGAGTKSTVPQLPKASDGLPPTLARVLGGGLDTIKWRHIVPGADDRLIKFPGRTGIHTLRFLRGKPGATLPEHAHVGTELTLVLHGALRDGENIYGPGDVTDMDDEGTHNPVVHGQETCICVIANEAPPRFRQLKFRVLQKLIGI